MANLETTILKKTSPTWKLVVLTVLGFVLVAALALIVRKSLDEPAVADQKVVQGRLEKLHQLRKEEHETVTSYSWVDKSAGVVRIPVEQAVALTVKELQGKNVQKSSMLVAPVVPAPTVTSGTTSDGVKK
jgi:hypothetical protein